MIFGFSVFCFLVGLFIVYYIEWGKKKRIKIEINRVYS